MYEDSRYAQFKGLVGDIAMFRIVREEFPDGGVFDKLLVAYEGKWTEREAMSGFEDYALYEEVQETCGNGFIFEDKAYTAFLGRSLFRFDFGEKDDDSDYVLAVPASGEDLNFEIYGVNQFGALVLILQREL